MAHSAVTQLYGDDGYVNASGSASAGPASVAAGLSLGPAGMHLTFLGVIAFLVLLWAIVRVAGFRFVVTTGVGR